MSLPLEFTLWVALVAVATLAVSLFWIGVAHLRYFSYYRSVGDAMPDRGSAGWPRIYLRILKSMVVLVWWALRGAFQGGLRMPVAETSGGPVICVHGFHMNSTSMWGIRLALERDGRPTRAVFLGRPYHRPQTYAVTLERALLDLVERFPGQPVDLVAHSMGGLVARAVLAESPKLAARMGRIVTLGSPHEGTALLRWIRFGPVYDMMGRNSEFLRRLPDFQASTPRAMTTNVATVPDFVVYPEETAHQPGARVVTIRGLGHSGLLIEPQVIDLVVDILTEEPSQLSAKPLEIVL